MKAAIQLQVLAVLLGVLDWVTPFSISPLSPIPIKGHHQRIALNAATTNELDNNDYESSESSNEGIKIKIKKELLELATMTNRGFTASRENKEKARELCQSLKSMNPTMEPLYPYYTEKEKSDNYNTNKNTNKNNNNNDDELPSLAGKWTLVYTDAPDITTLDNGGPLPAAKLGRIGQECDPPLVKNVIEWVKPDWASRLPFLPGAGVGDDNARVLQKVCTEASASPSDPLRANLKVVGLDLVGSSGGSSTSTSESTSTSTSTITNISNVLGGGPAKFFEDNPLELRGPLKTPFGSFEVLYLDEDMRIIKTYQGYLAVNQRQLPGEEWF